MIRNVHHFSRAPLNKLLNRPSHQIILLDNVMAYQRLKKIILEVRSNENLWSKAKTAIAVMNNINKDSTVLQFVNEIFGKKNTDLLDVHTQIDLTELQKKLHQFQEEEWCMYKTLFDFDKNHIDGLCSHSRVQKLGIFIMAITPIIAFLIILI